MVECVPNFSEGRRKEVIDAIASAISSTKGCALLDVDPGATTNRTVYTFVGEPEAVIQGALNAARVGHKLIDMSQQKGSHPRVGAMDVCPFIPVKNINIEECVDISKRFGELLSKELDVPVYLYAESQQLSYRKELGDIRKGEYEALEDKLKNDEKMKPDFGPTEFRPRYGASCVGARNFLIAYNVNVLGTKEQAHRIALNVREQGRGVDQPGRCKNLKAIGWYLDEQNLAQISINLTDFNVTNFSTAYEECAKDALELGVGVCGSEVVGLIPLSAMLMAADFFIQKERLMILDEGQKIKLVVNRLGLDSITPFKPREKIIEYLVQDRLENNENEYRHMSLKQFVDIVAARTSLPGGGSVSALVASLGSALACMGSQLTFGNRKFESLDAQIRSVLPQFYNTYKELLDLCDQDAKSFNTYMEARRIPEKTEADKERKKEAVEKGLIGCIEVPYTIALKSFKLWPYLRVLAPIFNIQTKSDVLVAVKCLEAGIYGAFENVKINSKDFDGVNKELVAKFYDDTEQMWLQSKQIAQEIIELIDARD